MPCKLDGCDKPPRNKTATLCGMHYHRFYRNGTFDILGKKARERYIQSAGYVKVLNRSHALAEQGGYVYEHRMVYFNMFGHGPFGCFWCGSGVSWDTLHIDHIDNDKENNDLSNLLASCAVCNQGRGHDKFMDTMRKKQGITLNGETKTINEWSEVIKMSRGALVARLRKMSIQEALTKPKGNHGPKSAKFL